MSLVGFQARNHPQQTAKTFVDDRETDPAMFAALHERYQFTIDVAASPHNTKLPAYYTAEQDGLTRPWNGRVWCNPPYSNIRPWVAKARTEILANRLAERVVMLLPANRTEQTWWQDLIEPYRDRGEIEALWPDDGYLLRTEFVRGRTRFIAAGDTGIKPNARPPFGCVLCVWEKP